MTMRTDEMDVYQDVILHMQQTCREKNISYRLEMIRLLVRYFKSHELGYKLPEGIDLDRDTEDEEVPK